MRSDVVTTLLFVAALTTSGLVQDRPAQAGAIALLDTLPHIHGLAVARAEPVRLYLATHAGLYEAVPEGLAKRLGASADDLMGFAVDPSDETTLYASGHRPDGGDLGFLRSDDGGRTWKKAADDARSPVGFHVIDISKADPRVVYGVTDGLQVSRDGGRSWRRHGTLPNVLYDFAASAIDPETIYAATRTGLMVSMDAGTTWRSAFALARPTSMVQVMADGTLYAFVAGIGLVRAKEPALAWKTISADFGDRTLIHLAGDPTDPKRLYGVADTGAVMTSGDGGVTWLSFEGSRKDRASSIARGRALYGDHCQSCHGADGVGERPDDIYAEDEYGFVAPPLDDSAHGWHHSDRALVNTILKGSPRNERMQAQKDVLSRNDAEDIVAYIKSLWSFRSLACQGARHMRCMR